jgi:hypothetical protein
MKELVLRMYSAYPGLRSAMSDSSKATPDTRTNMKVMRAGPTRVHQEAPEPIAISQMPHQRRESPK